MVRNLKRQQKNQRTALKSKWIRERKWLDIVLSSKGNAISLLNQSMCHLRLLKKKCCTVKRAIVHTIFGWPYLRQLEYIWHYKGIRNIFIDWKIYVFLIFVFFFSGNSFSYHNYSCVLYLPLKLYFVILWNFHFPSR